MVTLRIFFSSPGDVGEERHRAQLVAERLRMEFGHRIRIEPVFWEHEPLRATADFQSQIPRTSEMDIVVLILWSRLGTRLGPGITRPDGSAYSSGTEYEFEDAAAVHAERGTPDLLVYRKTAEPPPSSVKEPKPLYDERYAQNQALDAFIKEKLRNPDGTFESAFHEFASTALFEDLLERHLRKLIRQRIAALRPGEPSTNPPAWAAPPFRGLEPFRSDDTPIFFGRTEAVSDVLSRLRRHAATGYPFVVVFGASGAGKSSLACAGVLPLLTRPGVIEGIGLWRQAILRPGDSAAGLVDGLASALTSPGAVPELDAVGIEKLSTTLRDSPDAVGPLLQLSLSHAAAEVQRDEQLPNRPTSRLALLIDQMEEIFTLETITDSDRMCFVRALSSLARSGHVWVLATMRNDFYDRYAALRDLQAQNEGPDHFNLEPPSAVEIGQMIRNPAQMAGLSFDQDSETEERLDDTLRDEAAKNSETLPLLEFTLAELYRRQENGTLTLDAYRKMGGFEGAVASRAEEVFSALPPGAQSALPSAVRALVSLAMDTAATPTRRRAPMPMITADPQARELVEAFIAARLFVSEGSPDGSATVQVAHEALFRRWPRFADSIRANQDQLRLRTRIGLAITAWSAEGRSQGFLLPAGQTLDQAGQFLRQHRHELSPEEVLFVESSQLRVARRRKRVHWMRAAAAAAVLLAVGGALWYWDAYYREHVSYYTSCTYRWHRPEGILPISKSEAARRAGSVRLTRHHGRKGRVDRVEIVDASGVCDSANMLWPATGDSGISSTNFIDGLNLANAVNRDPGICRTEFTWKADGKPDTAESFAADGRRLSRVQFASDSLAYYSDDQGLTKARFKTGAAYLRSTFYSSGPLAGLERSVEYLDAFGHPQPDAEGGFGQACEYNERLLPSSCKYLGPDGKPGAGIGGMVGGRFAYTEHCRVREAIITGLDDKPLLVQGVGARVTLEYDSADRLSALTFRDTEGRPFSGAPLGFARMNQKYDARGYLNEISFVGADGNLIVQPFLQYAVARFIVDAKGNRREMAFYGADGKPMLGPEGYFRAVATFDSHGYAEDIRCYGTDDRPIVSKLGYASGKFKSDDVGNHLEESFYGVDGKPLPQASGAFRTRMTYDANHTLASLQLFGTDEKPVLGQNGFASARYTNDAVGYRIEESFYGVDGKPTLTVLGYFRARFTPDAKHQVIDVQYFGTDDKPLMILDRYARAHWVNDGAGNRIEESYYGLSGEPVLSRGGYFKIRTTFDGLHRLTSMAWFGTDDRPLRVPNMAARKEITYAADGKQKELPYDADGRFIPQIQYLFVPSTVVVARVLLGSQADRSGLRVGDVIVSYNGQRITDVSELNYMTNDGVGSRGIEIRRDGKLMNIAVSPGPLGVELTNR